MLFHWFNAREAVEVGTSLADDLLAHGRSPMPAGRGSRHAVDLQKHLQRAVREASTLQLNLFKRAKLLNSFKWRLLEHGYERSKADELTQALLLQLLNRRSDVVHSTRRKATTSPKENSLKRVPVLISEADECFAKGDPDGTVRRLQEVLAIKADDAIVRNKLGTAFYCLGRYCEAEQEFRHAIKLKATLGEAHSNLGILLCRKGEFGAAEAALRRALNLDPKNAEAHVSLGAVLSNCGRLREARDCFEKALRIMPRTASALCGLGSIASIEGHFEEAENLYRSAIEIEPRQPVALGALADLRRMTAADGAWLEKVRRLIATGIPPAEEVHLQFALGKYFDDTGSFAEAFAHYKRANDLQRALARPYDRKARAAFVDDMVRVYTRQLPAAEGSSDSARPVFVVGMMRSGTSLAEQIIASHPCAAGAGELDFWHTAAHSHQDVLRRELPDAALAKKLVGGYLETLAQHSADAVRVVDKSTFNSDHLGLIHTLFPNARIIYLRRDPVDTCLSCYFQHFAHAASFSMDLSDLAHYYREHHRLIRHWRSVLPPQVFLEVPYAELVRDQEGWSRRMIEFVGLEWDPRCLEFHKTERPVLTASNWQVRQPMYSRSVRRWRNYEKHIGPLLPLRELRLS